MAVPTDYRTNRADYAIAAKPKLTAVEAEAKKKAVRLTAQHSAKLSDQRSARLSENPSDTLAKPKPRPRG